MYSVSAALRSALDGAHAPCSRLLSLDADGTILATWEASEGILLSGTCSCTRTREVRRTLRLTLANPTGALSPKVPGDPFFPGARLRAERGAILGGTRFYVPLVTAVVDSFSAGMRGQLTIQASDVLSLCQQPLGAVVSLVAGITGEAAIVALLEPVLGDSSAWSLDAGGRLLGAGRSWAEDDDRLAAAVSLAADLGCELYADRLGNIVLRPVPDPTILATARTYVVAPRESAMLDLSRTGSSRPRNRQVVIGEGPDRTTVRGQADVDDPASPIHADRIGLQVAPYYRSAQIATQDQANAVARNLLIAQAFRQDAVSGPMLPDPTLDEGDVVAFAEEISGTNDRYWLASVDQPVVLGTMALAGPRAIPLFAS